MVKLAVEMIICVYVIDRGSIQEHLECVVSAIDSISYGDLVDLMVRRRQNWNLLPTQVDIQQMLVDIQPLAALYISDVLVCLLCIAYWQICAISEK